MAKHIKVYCKIVFWTYLSCTRNFQKLQKRNEINVQKISKNWVIREN